MSVSFKWIEHTLQFMAFGFFFLCLSFSNDEGLHSDQRKKEFVQVMIFGCNNVYFAAKKKQQNLTMKLREKSKRNLSECVCVCIWFCFTPFFCFIASLFIHLEQQQQKKLYCIVNWRQVVPLCLYHSHNI